MEILKYITIALTAILGIFAIIKDYKKKGGNKLNTTGALLTFLIIMSSIISICLEYLSDKDSGAKEVELRTNLKDLKHENDSLNNNLNHTRDTLENRISSLENDNYKLSTQLSKSTIELNKDILGEGYGIFEVYGNNTESDYYCGLLSNNKYALYDISLLVTDFDEAIKCRTSREGNKFMVDQNCYFKNSTNVKSNTLPPYLVNFVDYSFHSNSKFKNLEIIFTSRNSHILQQAVYKLQEGTCPQSFRIYKIEDKKMTLLKSYNNLKLKNSYWSTHFYPVQNRSLGILQK